MCQTKPEFRKKSVTPKVNLMISQVTESMGSSKKDVKQDKNPQKNPHERVTSTKKKKWEKRRQYPGLVSIITV